MGVLIPTVRPCHCRGISIAIILVIELTYTLTFIPLRSPQTAFGTLASGSLDPLLLVLRGFWVWLHLLQFCVSNQSVEPDEDSKNKPWRPIPAGNISVHSARRLRWLLLAACLALSAQTGVLHAGAALSFATWAHNEANLGSHWLTRNALNAVGYASFSIGASNAGCSGAYLGLPSSSDRHTNRLPPPLRSAWVLSGIGFTCRATPYRRGDLYDDTGTGLQGRRGRHPRQPPDATHPFPYRESCCDLAPRPSVVPGFRILLSDRRPDGVERRGSTGRYHRYSVLVRADTRRG